MLSPDLRARFVRSELSLFRHRFETDDVNERSAFLQSLQFDWQLVDELEKATYAEQLRTCMSWGTKDEQFRAESWFKVSSGYKHSADMQVPWYSVPDLVGGRRVFVKHGMAYVPQSLQISLVLQAFGSRLERALEVRHATA